MAMAVKQANERREDAIVRKLLKHDWCVVVLGGDHDLSDNADRQWGGTAEVVEVTVKVSDE